MKVLPATTNKMKHKCFQKKWADGPLRIQWRAQASKDA